MKPWLRMSILTGFVVLLGFSGLKLVSSSLAVAAENTGELPCPATYDQSMDAERGAKQASVDQTKGDEPTPGAPADPAN